MSIKVCRLCLQTIGGLNYFDINTVDQGSGFMPYRDQITTCIPEIAIDLVPVSLICETCTKSLKLAYEFKSMCLKVEEQIREHFEDKNPEDIDLADLIEEEDIPLAAIPRETIVERRNFQGNFNKFVKCKVEKVETDPLETIHSEINIKTEPLDQEECSDSPDYIQIHKIKAKVSTLVSILQNQKQDFVCDICPKTYSTALELEAHKALHASPSDPFELMNTSTTLTQNFMCNFCNICFSSLNTLRTHNKHCCNREQVPVQNPVLSKRPHLPLMAKNHLTEWLFNHSHHPYPTEVEKQILMKETNLTLLQVENWFINARRRVLQDFTSRRRRMRGIKGGKKYSAIRPAENIETT